MSTANNKSFSITDKVSLFIDTGKHYNSLQFRRVTKNGMMRRFYVNLTDVFTLLDKESEVETLLSLTSLGENTVIINISTTKFVEVKCFGDYKRPIAELRVKKEDVVQPWFFFFTAQEWTSLNQHKREITSWLHTEYKK